MGKTNRINEEIKKELLVSFMSGRTAAQTAKEIEDKMAVGAMEARRLVRTESAYIANMAEMDSYRELGIEQYEFVATLDMKTSAECAALDGKTFPVDEGVPGTNMPPMHPWCRSTTVAVIDGAVTAGLKRRARDPEPGENYQVPADMTYEQWKKELDSKHGAGYTDTKRKMVRNEKNDRKQYEKYISVLGKENMPKTFDLFQDLKYNDTEVWDDIKYYYRNLDGRPIKYVKIDRELEKIGISNRGKAYPIENIEVKGWRQHALNRLEQRGISETQALNYKNSAIGMLKKYPEPNTQNNYYSTEGILGIRISDGLVCTAYSQDEFKNDTLKILEVFEKWLNQ